MPIIAGGKLNGRAGNTNVGALVVGTNAKPGVVADEALHGRRRGSNRTSGPNRRSAPSPRWATRSGRVGKLAGRRRFHVRHVPLSRRQELARRRVGARDGPARTRQRRDGAMGSRSTTRTTSGTSTSSTSASGATSTRRSGSCRAGPSSCSTRRRTTGRGSTRGPLQQLFHQFQPFRCDRPVGKMGELPRVHRAGQLALSQRRSLRVQCQPDRRTAGRALRGRGRRRDRAGHVSLAAAIASRRHGAETSAVRAGHVVVRRLLRRRPRPVRLDWRLEPDPAAHRRVHGRAEHRPAAGRPISRRHSSAPAFASTFRQTCRSPATRSTTRSATRSG